MNSNSLLSNLQLWHKFLILNLVALILASIPTYLYTREAAKGLEAYQREQQGLPVIESGLKLVQFTQQHRGLSALTLGGIAAAEDKRAAKQKEADSAYAQVDAIIQNLHDPAIEQAWAQPKRDWETLRADVASKRISVPQSYTAHSELVPKLLKVNDLLGDHFGLSLDPDRDTYQLIQAMFYQLPYLTEELGKTRAKGAGLLAKKEASPADRLLLSSFVARVADRLDQTQTAFNKAAAANPEHQAKFGAAMQGAAQAAKQIGELALNQIVTPETLSYSAEEYVTLATQAIDLQFQLNAAVAAELDVILKEKISRFHVTRWTMLGAMLGLLALAGYIAMLISRSVTVPLNNAVELAQRVARGDLANDFDVGGTDEVGQMLRALKEMNGSLRTIVGDMRLSIHSIGTATQEIATGNADVSTRLEAQASNLEETASSMEQLTSTVQQNAENAQQANQLVISASSVATKGGGVVSQVVKTMGEINDSSRKIVDIISVIDGIAFQTNILALNAAVEAARAGEQGRGFAVVASEVRNLAQRSAAAAKEIKDLIVHSVGQVEVGNRLAADAGQAMDEIVGSVARITSIMSEIATASAEQGSGIEQVNQAVTQMDDMTQQNAALVEQTAAASASLQDQTQTLVRAISIFKLGDEDRGERLAAPATQSSLPHARREPQAGKPLAALR